MFCFISTPAGGGDAVIERDLLLLEVDAQAETAQLVEEHVE